MCLENMLLLLESFHGWSGRMTFAHCVGFYGHWRPVPFSYFFIGGSLESRKYLHRPQLVYGIGKALCRFERYVMIAVQQLHITKWCWYPSVIFSLQRSLKMTMLYRVCSRTTKFLKIFHLCQSFMLQFCLTQCLAPIGISFEVMYAIWELGTCCPYVTSNIRAYTDKWCCMISTYWTDGLSNVHIIFSTCVVLENNFSKFFLSILFWM